MESPKELNEKEQLETNGGSMLEGNNSSSEGGLPGNLGIGNLLSSETTNKYGNESSSSSFSIENNIGLDGIGFGKARNN